MANKLTPEEKAARATARQAAAQTEKEQSAQEVAEYSRPVAEPQPADSETAYESPVQAAPQPADDDPIDRQPVDDEQPEQETLGTSQESAAPSTEQEEEVPLSPATAYADTPAEVAARAAEAADWTEQPRTAAPDRLTVKGRQILKEYPTAEEVYMTSNGFGFFREQDARNHATTLRDKSVIIVKRK
ncbi:hypothetical protein [uncultured Alistipes sp.]|uniref:hypothetical protein n=1 Tax=uncultured Alistipes sp. TaxID=538949 RepID=UPI00272CEA17|nr:hypothetical protein [uncultured Alistipes sp.]